MATMKLSSTVVIRSGVACVLLLVLCVYLLSQTGSDDLGDVRERAFLQDLFVLYSDSRFGTSTAGEDITIPFDDCRNFDLVRRHYHLEWVVPLDPDASRPEEILPIAVLVAADATDKQRIVLFMDGSVARVRELEGIPEVEWTRVW